jgi:hypothetical protein
MKPPFASIAWRNTSSWAANAVRIAAASFSHRRVGPSISVNRNVTTPEGAAAGLADTHAESHNRHAPTVDIGGQVRARCARSMTSKVLDAVATSAPEASVTVPSVKATRDPDLTTAPVAVSTPLEGRTALRKFTLISTEVKPLPFGSALCSAERTAVSRSVQTRPPQTAPTALYALVGRTGEYSLAGLNTHEFELHQLLDRRRWKPVVHDRLHELPATPSTRRWPPLVPDHAR